MLLASIASLALARSAAALELSELAALTRPSVVLLQSEDSAGHSTGNGTGFVVSPDGRVVTNHHVIASATRLTAILSDGRKRAVAGVLIDDEEADLAVVQVVEKQLPALVLGDSNALRPGDPVAVIGSPAGFEGTLSDGIVAALRPGGADFRGPGGKRMSSWQVQITAPISPGSSGSPVLTRDGRVVGVAVGQAVRGQNLNFAIPSAMVQALLSRIAAGATPRPLGPSILRNLLLSLAIFAAFSLPLSWRYVRRLRRSRFTWQPEPSSAGTRPHAPQRRRSPPARER